MQGIPEQKACAMHAHPWYARGCYRATYNRWAVRTIWSYSGHRTGTIARACIQSATGMSCVYLPIQACHTSIREVTSRPCSQQQRHFVAGVLVVVRVLCRAPLVQPRMWADRDPAGTAGAARTMSHADANVCACAHARAWAHSSVSWQKEKREIATPHRCAVLLAWPVLDGEGQGKGKGVGSPGITEKDGLGEHQRMRP